MLIDAILKIHAKIMDEPLGTKRAAELAESGHETELVPSSIKFAPKGNGTSAMTALGDPRPSSTGVWPRTPAERPRDD